MSDGSNAVLTNTASSNSSSLGIKGRIFIGFGVLTLILFLMVAITLVLVNTLKNTTKQTIEVELPTYDTFLNLGMDIYKSQTFLQEWIMTKNPEVKSNFNMTWDNSIKPIINQLDQLQKNWSNSEMINQWNKIKPYLVQLNVLQNKLINTDLSLITSENLRNSINEINLSLDKIFSLIDGPKNELGIRQGGLFDTQLVQLNNNSLAVIHYVNNIQLSEYVISVVFLLSALIIALSTLKSISSVTNKIIEACHNMVVSLDEVQHVVDMQSAGASEQAASINEITVSLEEIEKSSNQTMEKAQALGEVAERTQEKGQIGLEAVVKSTGGMKAVRDKVQAIAQNILELSNQTQQVGEITSVVNTLAQQSKMLALNASIEAAKAGEAGKGFAVVAVEVKNLAEQSEQATSEVQKILENIRHAAEKAVMVTEEGTKEVDSGAGLVEQTGGIVRNLSDVIHETTIASQQIEAAVRQESVGIEQITTGMSEINKVTSSFVESVNQTTEAIANLTEIARKLKEQINTFKT